MQRTLQASLVWSILTFCAFPARAEKANDALAGPRAPAPVAWRLPPRSVADSHPFMAYAAGSLQLIDSFRRELAAEPAGKGKAEILQALTALEASSSAAAPEDRQSWIDSHLGNLNSTIRAIAARTPASTLRAAARATARLNIRAERWQEGREFAELALARNPNDRDALIIRSQANAGLADYTRAYADAENATRLAPDAPAAYTARSAAAYGLGNYLQAGEDARRALALEPEDKTAFALMKLSEGRVHAAPDMDKTPARLADSVEREYYGMMQQLAHAEERRRAPVENPAPGAARRLISSAGYKLSVKDYWGAIEEADKALALDPANAQALYFRAAAHNLIGEYGEATRDATRGLMIEPTDSALRDARAWAYNRMGRSRDAIADAQRALDVNPRDSYAYVNRAYANEQSGDYEAMFEDYRTATKFNPQFEPVYRDAARRHGLSFKPLSPDRGFFGFAQNIPKRTRSFATILLLSLAGGLLMALGILHVTSGAKQAPAKAAPPSGFEANYQIGKALGQGGMGVVYEGFDRKLLRPVAIKMLRDEFKLDDDAKERFIEEARTVAELHHPAIVDIHGIVEDERGVYLVFERLEGRTLDQVLAERKRLSLTEIKKVLKPVCEALEYAHAHDVVHRDLKPPNVMLVAGGGIRVLDFGISRHAARQGDKAAVTQTVVGTPHYMAPEQEKGVVRKESDVFSLGAMLYELATGVRPYEGSRKAKLARDYRRASQRVRGLALELDALIERALDPDPEKRIPTPAEFLRELLAVPDAG